MRVLRESRFLSAKRSHFEGSLVLFTYDRAVDSIDIYMYER